MRLIIGVGILLLVSCCSKECDDRMVFSEGYLVDAVYYHKSGLVNYEDYLVDEVVISSDLIIFKNEREILFLEKNNVENLKLKRQ